MSIRNFTDGYDNVCKKFSVWNSVSNNFVNGRGVYPYQNFNFYNVWLPNALHFSFRANRFPFICRPKI